MCFFFKTLERFNKEFGALFGKRDEQEGDEDGGDEDDFEKSFGWLYNCKRVADYENITLDSCFRLGVIQFLNDLVYLKEYEAHERKMIKNARNSEQQ